MRLNATSLRAKLAQGRTIAISCNDAMAMHSPTYQEGLLRLNGCNLESVLAQSSVLSALEFYPNDRDLLFPLLNNEMVRLFADAVLASSAQTYKQNRLGEDDFRLVFNALDDALHDRRIDRELTSGEERERLLYAATKSFARMANLQMRQQELHLAMHAGRAVGMFETLPQRDLSFFADSAKPIVSRFASLVRGTLGASVHDLALAHLAVSFWYKRLSERVWELLRASGDLSGRGVHLSRAHRQAKLLHAARRAAEQLEHVTSFTANSLRQFVNGALTTAVVDAYLAIVARSARKLREIGREPAYRLGPDGWRLSPLERFPVIELESSREPRYVIPNVRTHLRAFSDIIHFTLQDSLGDSFNSARGALQEVYLRRMVEEELPSLIIVPEGEYRRGKSMVRGPDLTIFDPTDGTLIVVERRAGALWRKRGSPWRKASSIETLMTSMTPS